MFTTQRARMVRGIKHDAPIAARKRKRKSRIRGAEVKNQEQGWRSLTKHDEDLFRFVAGDLDGRGIAKTIFRAQGNQLTVEGPQRTVGMLAFSGMLQRGVAERGDALRIGDLPGPSEGGEFGLAPFAYGFNQMRVFMTREIQKWRGLSVFFAHEQHGHER